jgi:threonylcarbamoyladenosine tRNA methylthiotransferase MtaB
LRYAILTFGCRVNQADSLEIEEKLREGGGTEAPSASADVVIVNTCSVTSTADQGARQAIRRVARENPSARIFVTGCYATRRPDEVGALPNVVRVIRNDDKHGIHAEIATAARFGDGDGPCGAAIGPGAAGRTAYTLRVQTGCEERCSYCIIPSTRGAGRSVAIADVLREVSRLAMLGYKEIVLTGVHLGSYGRDLMPEASLLDLLTSLGEISADVTYRISSLEPMDCSRDIITLVAGSGGRFAPHFHLPLQHGSDRMLRLMRRPYTVDYYRRLVDGLLEQMPHASIGSDMIAGFPGEEHEDFLRSLEYVSASPLSHVHVFPYSDRPGTEASGMARKVEGNVTRERGARLRQAGAERAQRFRRSQVGGIRPALTVDDGTAVVTDNYLKLRIPPGLARNERVRVRVVSETAGEVVG